MASLLRASAESEARTLTRVGGSLVLLITIATASYFTANPFGRKPNDVISVAIEAPYVGQGVAGGTPVIMNGVTVGKVTSIASLSNGAVRLKADLQSGPTTGLTDTMGIDFRPSNYFGVTGVNLIPGKGGRPIHSGVQINITPKGNFSLQALLYRLGELSDQVVNQRLISVVDRATRYTDALNPLLETMLIVGESVTKVQAVSTERLLRNTTGMSVAFPGFVDAVVRLGDLFLHTPGGLGFDPQKDYKDNPFVPFYDDKLMNIYKAQLKWITEDREGYVYGPVKEWVDHAKTDLFGLIGKLEGSHIYDLFPVVEELRVISDVIPKLVNAEGVGDTLRELRARFERLYAGSGDQRAMQVRIILDSLPGVAAPLDLALGGSR
jgi:hypothetical protein